MWAASSRTFAPASRAAAASATPCLPEERFPRNRTGSRGSRVPPALIVTVSPASGLWRRRKGRRPTPAAAASRDTAGAPARASAASKMASGSGSRPGPESDPVSRAGGGLQHRDAPAAERLDIGLGRRVLPHLGVHGRGHQHRAAAGHEQGVAQEVVGLAGGGACQQVGRGGGHHDQLGFVAEADVVDGVHLVEDAVADRMPGQRFPRGDADEAGRGLRGDDRDVMAGFSKKPEERRHLVGGYPSPDSEDYAHVTSVCVCGITLQVRSGWKRACLR